MRRSILNLARTATSLVAGLVVAFVAGYAALLVTGFKPVAVYSGSMEPKLAVGSLAVDRQIDASKVRVGDVITFPDPYLKGRLVTHRVVQILRTTKGPAYRTKGDANVSRDPWTIRLDGRVGRVAFDVPFAGYALFYAHTREVRGIVIVIAAVFILIGLLRRIWRTEAPAVEGRMAP
jgi:signal peptidase